jgi:methylated-DNA-[protein]-cysteine S-methyltransferase
MYARDHALIATPIGAIRVEGDEAALTAIRIGGEGVPSKGSATAVRAGLIAVGYGETLSYGALARALGSSPRAIGQLCARNPFPIVVPCHRVLGEGGRLGNYSGGDGPKTKSWLLEHERRQTKGTLL